MATYHDVKKQIAALEKQATDLFKKEVAGVISQIRNQMSQYGLTVQDLGGGITRVGKKMSAMKKKAPTQPKYRDPASGKTWSGKGRAPAWMAEAIKKGKQDDFLIGKSAAPAAAKQSVPAKKAAPVKKAAPAKQAPVKKAVAAKPVAAKKPVVKKAAPSPKPAAAKKAPVVKKAAVAKKPAAVKKPAAKAKVAPKAKLAAKAPAPKAAPPAPAATPAAKA